jgi:hypothetical protein
MQLNSSVSRTKMATLAALGALVYEPHPNYAVMFANFVSNFL